MDCRILGVILNKVNIAVKGIMALIMGSITKYYGKYYGNNDEKKADACSGGSKGQRAAKRR